MIFVDFRFILISTPSGIMVATAYLVKTGEKLMENQLTKWIQFAKNYTIVINVQKSMDLRKAIFVILRLRVTQRQLSRILMLWEYGFLAKQGQILETTVRLGPVAATSCLRKVYWMFSFLE